jgi:hypothetical protein
MNRKQRIEAVRALNAKLRPMLESEPDIVAVCALFYVTGEAMARYIRDNEELETYLDALRMHAQNERFYIENPEAIRTQAKAGQRGS